MPRLYLLKCFWANGQVHVKSVYTSPGRFSTTLRAHLFVKIDLLLLFCPSSACSFIYCHEYCHNKGGNSNFTFKIRYFDTMRTITIYGKNCVFLIYRKWLLEYCPLSMLYTDWSDLILATQYFIFRMFWCYTAHSVCYIQTVPTLYCPLSILYTDCSDVILPTQYAIY